VLSDLGKINSLLSVARQYVITDSGWDLLDFATQMRGLDSSNLTFRTLPIQGYATIDGQDANQVDPAQIKQIVNQVFYPPAPTPAASVKTSAKPTTTIKDNPSLTTVDVYNGGSTPGLASQVSTALVKDGYKPGLVANTTALSATQVLYGSGSSASGAKIASLFGVSATASSTLAAGHVEVMLGSGAAVPGSSSSASASASASAGSASAVPTSGAQGGAVNAKNGIPCVD